MNAPQFGLSDHLRALLAQASPLTATQLQRATGKSQPSISLALSKLGPEVHKLGAARSTRYALTQSILGLDAAQPVHLAGPHTDQGLFGTLVLLRGNLVHVRGPRNSEWLADGTLPWWLSSLRPQGFIGRQFARLRPDYASDPDQWTLAQVLYMAANHLPNPPGAFAIGQQKPAYGATITHADRGATFDRLADAAADNLPTGSSAGGEQPKFLHRIGDTHVIVKFSPPRGTPFGERWHDLLHLEHLAGEILRGQGIAAAQTELLYTARRTYLQSSRFDRIGATGKRHVVAASAIHDAFVEAPRRHWVATCEALSARKLLAPEHVRTVAGVYLFGQYIGNTDMHFGNLSFFVDEVTKPVLVPTPVYDMLPMIWRPGIHGGELDSTPIGDQIQPAGFEAQARQARMWAIAFWEHAARMPKLSSTSRKASANSARNLTRQIATGK